MEREGRKWRQRVTGREREIEMDGERGGNEMEVDTKIRRESDGDRKRQRWRER